MSNTSEQNKLLIFSECLNNLDKIAELKRHVDDDWSYGSKTRSQIQLLESLNESLYNSLFPDAEFDESVFENNKVNENKYNFISSPGANFGKVVYEFFKRKTSFPKTFILPKSTKDFGANFLVGRMTEEEYIREVLFPHGPLNFNDKVYKDIEEGTIFTDCIPLRERYDKYMTYIQKNNIEITEKIKQEIKQMERLISEEENPKIINI